MLGLQWNRIDERYFEHGLDRGVLYLTGQDPKVWNGLVSFDEDDEGGETSMLYRDGIVFLADVEASDFKGKLSAMFFPEEFRECVGFAKPADGFYVANQKPKRFGFSYRTLVGSGLAGDRFGYQIHLVYNAMASIGSRNRRTADPQKQLVDFTFDIVCTPIKLQGYRPTAHYIIDTRNLAPAKLQLLEEILYGVSYGTGEDIIVEPITDPMPGGVVGRLPTPAELLAIIEA